MKKIALVIAIVIVVLLVSIILPWVAHNYAKDLIFFSDATKALSSICSLGTLILAILLYNKYGIDSRLIEKKSEIVFDLMGEFNKIEFSVQSDGQRVFTLFVRLNWKNTIKIFEDYSSLPVCFSNSVFNTIRPIKELCGNPFMPLNIVEACEAIQFASLSGIENKENKYAVVKDLKAMLDNDSFVGTLDHKEMTLKDFLMYFENIRIEIKKWLQDNAGNKIEINF